MRLKSSNGYNLAKPLKRIPPPSVSDRARAIFFRDKNFIAQIRPAINRSNHMNLLNKDREHFASATPASSPSGKSNRETDHDYQNVIFEHGIWRVIACRDSLQWVIQRSKPDAGRRHGLAWRGLSYCTARSGLEIDWRRHTGFTAPELADFPEHFSQRSPEVAA